MGMVFFLTPSQSRPSRRDLRYRGVFFFFFFCQGSRAPGHDALGRTIFLSSGARGN